MYLVFVFDVRRRVSSALCLAVTRHGITLGEFFLAAFAGPNDQCSTFLVLCAHVSIDRKQSLVSTAHILFPLDGTNDDDGDEGDAVA